MFCNFNFEMNFSQCNNECRASNENLTKVAPRTQVIAMPRCLTFQLTVRQGRERLSSCCFSFLPRLFFFFFLTLHLSRSLSLSLYSRDSRGRGGRNAIIIH